VRSDIDYHADGREKQPRKEEKEEHAQSIRDDFEAAASRDLLGADEILARVEGLIGRRAVELVPQRLSEGSSPRQARRLLCASPRRELG
jgi:hypothetical protein